MALLLWEFWTYSFLGYLLEKGFAAVTHAEHRTRKCFLLLPLCPVYGLGACAILLLPSWVASVPLLLFLGSALAATSAEYLMALFYEEVLGVSFWDYRELPGNIQGRVCLPFSLAWGLLSLPLVYWVHPALSPLLQAIPRPVTWLALATLLADALLSGLLLRRTGNRHCLQWYAVRG